MSLTDFIRRSIDRVLEVSVEFARTLPSMSGIEVDISVLRDHLPLVLEAIARDLEQPQSGAESITKAAGGAAAPKFETAAQAHGRLRADNGLTVAQLVAEYRVLRAAVLRLWLESGGGLDAGAARDIARFNEAIDQAIAESVAFHSAAVDRWRQILLAVIGHDLRGPLNAITLTTEVLSVHAADGPLGTYAKSLKRSSARLAELLDSLLEYNRALLGAPMPLHRQSIDLGDAARAEIEQLKAGLPNVTIGFDTQGSLVGEFDGSRVREALGNLVFNAAQYRTPGTTIKVRVTGSAHDVVVAVANEAAPIDPQVLASLFEPLRRRTQGGTGERRNLGLGLFIVREIAKAHGGDVGASAKGGEVEFTMRLPKDPATPI